MKVRSIAHPERTYTLEYPNIETCANSVDKYGDIVRPHIVFFGEDVPLYTDALDIVADADILVIIGTSLVVYPAAALVNFTKKGTPIFYIDPKPSTVSYLDNITYIAKKATEGMTELAEILRKNYI
jgi:NAD-dependent deacetylase